MSTVNMKKGDRLPEYTAQLFQGVGLERAAIDLTGTTVRIHLRDREVGDTKVDAAAAIVTAAEGRVKYAWGATDTDRAGNYDVEWEITYPDTRTLTVPSKDFDLIVINGDIA